MAFFLRQGLVLSKFKKKKKINNYYSKNKKRGSREDPKAEDQVNRPEPDRDEVRDGQNREDGEHGLGWGQDGRDRS